MYTHTQKCYDIKMNTTIKAKQEPFVGQPATILHWSDRTACTVVDVNEDEKVITVRECKATRIDGNGMSECQDYEYEENEKGSIHRARLCKDGLYHIGGVRGTIIALGYRREYYDYSF